MRTTLKMSDLKYKDGFPANIDRNHLVVVQIQTGNKQNRFKAVGNGWTVDVIAHILRSIWN